MMAVAPKSHLGISRRLLMIVAPYQVQSPYLLLVFLHNFEAVPNPIHSDISCCSILASDQLLIDIYFETDLAVLRENLDLSSLFRSMKVDCSLTVAEA
jgi:hypothetical protein